MITRTLGLAAGLAVAAEAFLVPSSISLPGLTVDVDQADGEFHTLEMPSGLTERLRHLYPVVDFNGRQVEEHDEETGTALVSAFLPCPNCNLKEYPGATSNSLVLQFSPSSDRKVVLLNGRPFFPLEAQDGPLFVRQEIFEADGVAMGEEQHEVNVAVNDLSESQIRASAGSRFGDGSKSVHFTMELTESKDERINLRDLMSVDVSIQYNEDGDIVRFMGIPYSPRSHSHFASAIPTHSEHQEDESEVAQDLPCPPGSDPSLLLCRLRNAIKEKIADWHFMHAPSFRGIGHSAHRRPCPGKFRFRPDGVEGPPPLRGGPAKFMSPDEFEAYRAKSHHRHHHSSGIIHAVASALRTFVVAFVIPVCIGVLAGMAASVLGMAVGSLIAFVWVRFVRGGRRGDQHSRHSRLDDEDYVSEKEALLDQVPAYTAGEAPPLYLEKE